MFFVIRLKRVIIFVTATVIMLSCYGISKYIPIIATPTTNKVIVIDAGHGGFDPGAVGKDGTLEKEINLKIAMKLQQLLEQNAGMTVMTRVDDEALARNKVTDMRERRKIRDANEASLFISIHLNSFPQEIYKGAQTFYPKDEKSKMLAQYIQDNIREVVKDSNERVPKLLTDVYMLKDIKVPSVIVECGFLSNKEEEIKLSTEEYQSKIAWGIYLGIIEYFANL